MEAKLVLEAVEGRGGGAIEPFIPELRAFAAPDTGPLDDVDTFLRTDSPGTLNDGMGLLERLSDAFDTADPLDITDKAEFVERIVPLLVA